MSNPVKLTLGAMRHLLPDPSTWDLFDVPDVDLPEVAGSTCRGVAVRG